MRRILISTAALLAALTLAGCSAAGGSSAGDSGTADRAPSVADGSGGAAYEDSASGGGEAAAPDEDRQVITTGWMTVTVDDAEGAAADAARIATEAGGRVDARTEYAADGDRAASAVLTLRIPGDRLEAALTELKALGSVQQLQQEVADVTTQSRDLDARISALRTTIQRFEGLVTNAATVEDLITLEQAISDRQAQLESMESQRRALADQVAMSSIQVTLQSESVAPARTPDSFLDGLAAGWAAFVAFWAALLVALGVALPWLVTLGVAALVIVLIVRRARRLAPQLAGPVPATAGGPAAPSAASAPPADDGARR